MIRGVAAIAALVLLFLGAQMAAARPLQLADYLRWETAGSPSISPDGRTIVYQRSRVDPVGDRYDSELWVMNSDGSDARPLALRGSGAAWRSPTEISYFVAGEQGSRLVRRIVRSAATATAEPEVPIAIDGPAPSSITWSPDGSSFAYLADVPRTGDRWPIALPERPAGARWKADPMVIDQLQFRVGPGNNQYRTSDRHLFIVPATGGAARRLTSGEWSIGTYLGSTFEWSPDGGSIVFEGVPDGPDDVATALESRLNRIDIATRNIERMTREPGFWRLPRISPDGRHIAYNGYRQSRDAFPVHELRVMDADGSNDRLLWRDMPDRIFNMKWENDGALLVSSNHHGSTELIRVAMDGTRTAVVTGAYRFGFSTHGGGIAVGSLNSPQRASEIAAVDLATGAVRLLTHHNRVLDEVQLGRVDSFWARSADGTPVQAWLVYPPDFDPSRRYPLILDIHGGPDTMTGFQFDFRYQDFAARGYLVLYSNPRGSTGYGAAFANGIDGGFPGERDLADLNAVLQSAFDRNIVDRDRVFVMGCSGGGTLAAWLTARTRHFAASTVMCPVTNWISMLGVSDVVAWAVTRFERPFWEDPTPWLEHSPIMRAGDINTPTLFAMGAQDGRTPLSQAVELYTALKLRGVPTRLLILPEEGHAPWTAVPSDLMRLQLYMDEWYRTRGHPGDRR